MLLLISSWTDCAHSAILTKMRRNITRVIGFGIIALTVYALPFHAHSEDIGEPLSRETTEQALAVLEQGIKFRQYVIANGLGPAADHFATNDAFSDLLSGELIEANPVIWKYFFSGAVLSSGQTPDNSHAIIYYSYLIDAAVITKWQINQDQSLRIIESYAVTGASLKNPSETVDSVKPQRWAMSPVHPAIEMATHGFEAIAKFESLFPLDSNSLKKSVFTAEHSIGAKLAIERSAFFALKRLNDLRDKPNNHPVKASFMRTLRAFRSGSLEDLHQVFPKQNGVNTITADDVLLFRPDVRERFSAKWIQSDDEHTFVLVTDSRTPTILLALDFTSEGKISSIMALPVSKSSKLLRDSLLKTRK